jgi:hypothetical protein
VYGPNDYWVPVAFWGQRKLLVEYERKTVVKYCERYGEGTHRTLADAGMSAQLRWQLGT